MLEELKKLKEKLLAEIALGIPTLTELEKLQKRYFGRKGEFTVLLKQVSDFAIEERREIGKYAQSLRQELEDKFSSLTETIRSKEEHKETAAFDATLPGIQPHLGTLHPITQMIFRVWDTFRALNFDVVDGPEIETEYYNFEALNMPKEHPARDMQETFFLDGGYVLRTQTSTVQIHTMEERKPPLRILSAGKTYRRDLDLRHLPMFHQFEGLMIDKDVNMSHLKKMLQIALSEILEREVAIRFRISYFPFVEPGAEFDVTCTLCGGKGCAICKKSGWLEMGGCGMVHPNVLRNVGIDPEEWQGFAFGFGIERPVMIKHQIGDIRLFVENDLRFLEQFT